MLAASLILMMAPLSASNERLLVVDIGAADAVEVAALKRPHTDGWWLELGDRLVLVGAPERLAENSMRTPIVAAFDGIDPAQLALRARGCSEHAEEAGTLVARGGRWELRLLADGEHMPDHHDGGWQRVERNSVIARQYRLDIAGGPAPPDPLVQPVVNAVDSARWFADVQTLSAWDRSSYGGASLVAARDWIASQFTALGLQASTQAFNMSSPSGTITRHNVIGRWTGTEFPNEWVIVGAHYDSRNASGSSTVNTPGAEDNASGCAGVIEIARALLPFQPQRSVLFMCYAGEEQNLLGSKAHVQTLTQGGDLAKVKSVVIMDMIGYSADANLQALFESYSQHSAYLNRFAAAAATYVPALDVLISTQPFGSDHMPYLGAGVQTLLAIEADYDLYPHYHEATDTPANMGVHAQAMGGAILKTNVAVLADLVGAKRQGFADGFEVAGASN